MCVIRFESYYLAILMKLANNLIKQLKIQGLLRVIGHKKSLVNNIKIYVCTDFFVKFIFGFLISCDY